MKKRNILWIASVFLISSGTTVLAGGDHQMKKDHKMMQKGHTMDSKHMDHGSCGDHGECGSHMNHEGKMAKLVKVKSKKAQVHSKAKKFTAHLGKVPGTTGHAMFNIKLKNKKGKAVSSGASIKGTLRMPGMEMDLPPVKVKHKKGEYWILGTDIPMAGLWKIHLTIKDQGIQDKLTIKFIAK